MADWNLPTFEGDKDRTTARKMIDNLGGADGIRTKIITEADGGTTMLRTRNGFPHIKTDKPEQKQQGYSLWHGIAVDVTTGSTVASVFYTEGSDALRSRRSETVSQSGVKNYHIDGVGYIYSLTADGLGLWDLSKRTMTALPASVGDFSYSSLAAKNGSELTWSLPKFYGNEYFIVTPLKVVDSQSAKMAGEIAVENIGYEDLTAKATPPVIASDGKAHLCAYKTKVISPTAGISQYNWTGTEVANISGSFSETLKQATSVAPVVLDRTVTSDVGVGALNTYEPVVWYRNVYHYPGGFVGSGSAEYFHFVIGGGIETPSEPGLFANGGWHDDTTEQVRCLKDVTVDTIPIKFSIDASYDSTYKAQRAALTERVTNYDSLDNVLGYGISMAYTNLHTIDFTQTGNVLIKATVGEFEVELLRATGNSSATGKDNSWQKVPDVRGLPPTFLYAGKYYFAANGSPLPSPPTEAAIIATFPEMPSIHPATEIWNAQFGGVPIPVVYQVENYHGSATCEATGFYVTDCDPTTSFVAGIECEVKVSASFRAPTGDGLWDMGTSFVFDHEVSIYFTWIWRGEKKRKTLISTIVRKPPPFPAAQKMNPFVEDTDSTPIYHLTLPEFKMGSETFDQLVGLRNHQGVNPCYAGHSLSEESVTTLTGLAPSTSTIRTTGAGVGMIYTRTFAKGDLNNCVWLLERLGVSNPLSSAPLETDLVLTRPYGYSDALYEALTNTEYKVHLMDGVEVDWPNTLTADASATFVCKRV